MSIARESSPPAPVDAAAGLPVGYTVGGAWGFHDPEGRSYEFFRVYQPVHGRGDRECVTIDEARSYWSVTAASSRPGEDVHLEHRVLSYAAARKLSSSRLTFRRFSSLLAMTDVVPRLFAGRS